MTSSRPLLFAISSSCSFVLVDAPDAPRWNHLRAVSAQEAVPYDDEDVEGCFKVEEHMIVK